MQIQVSLSLERNANATLTQMEEQIQEAGHQWMREALQKTVQGWEHTRGVCPIFAPPTEVFGACGYTENESW